MVNWGLGAPRRTFAIRPSAHTSFYCTSLQNSNFALLRTNVQTPRALNRALTSSNFASSAAFFLSRAPRREIFSRSESRSAFSNFFFIIFDPRPRRVGGLELLMLTRGGSSMTKLHRPSPLPCISTDPRRIADEVMSIEHRGMFGEGAMDGPFGEAFSCNLPREPERRRLPFCD